MKSTLGDEALEQFHGAGYNLQLMNTDPRNEGELFLLGLGLYALETAFRIATDDGERKVDFLSENYEGGLRPEQMSPANKFSTRPHLDSLVKAALHLAQANGLDDQVVLLQSALDVPWPEV